MFSGFTPVVIGQIWVLPSCIKSKLAVRFPHKILNIRKVLYFIFIFFIKGHLLKYIEQILFFFKFWLKIYILFEFSPNLSPLKSSSTLPINNFYKVA